MEQLSNKEAFQLWKKKFESEFRYKFTNQLSDVMELNGKPNLVVGDKVMFTNDNKITFGPFEILAFNKEVINGRCVYLDFDCYWFQVKPEQLTLVK